MRMPAGELEERLRAAEAFAVVGRGVTAIAHDFNNVLCSILGCGELLLGETPAHSSQSERLRILISAALRGRDMVAQLLAYARSQTAAHHELIDFCDSVSATLDLIEVSLPVSIELKRRIPQGPLWVIGDATGLHQVVMNLCVNAVHAMQSGTLRVAIAPTDANREHSLSHGTLSRGHYVALCVADEGCGMDETTLAQIFAPFFTTKDHGRGTGLGLATVKAIIDQLSGVIDVKSVRGVGTAVCIYLPGVQPPATPDLP